MDGRLAIRCQKSCILEKQENNLSVRIRLRRLGAKKRPFYRLVVANRTDARDGRFIETIGYYDPLTDPPTVKLNVEKVNHWLSVGAQPSDTARAILQGQGIAVKAAKLPFGVVAKPKAAATAAE